MPDFLNAIKNVITRKFYENVSQMMLLPAFMHMILLAVAVSVAVKAA